MSTSKSHILLSASDIAEMVVPDLMYYIEGILRNSGGKASIIAKKKMGKSFLAIDWGLHISEGREYLGFNTSPANVLYVNFEISHEKLMERIQDIQFRRGFVAPNFKILTKLEGMGLDKDHSPLIKMLEVCEQGEFPVNVLILDPRIKSMERDENEGAVVNAYTKNLDEAMALFPNLSMLIVHHEGKSTTGAGRGHSSYDGWLDTMIKIKPKSSTFKHDGEHVPKEERTLFIEGRDMETEEIGVRFKYPIYELAPDVMKERVSKVEKAKEFILTEVNKGNTIEQKQLRLAAITLGHTDYALNRALRELKESGKVKESKAEGQGNRKLLSAP
jgi:RecA-family ATPase